MTALYVLALQAWSCPHLVAASPSALRDSCTDYRGISDAEIERAYLGQSHLTGVKALIVVVDPAGRLTEPESLI